MFDGDQKKINLFQTIFKSHLMMVYGSKFKDYKDLYNKKENGIEIILGNYTKVTDELKTKVVQKLKMYLGSFKGNEKLRGTQF
jgi:hypothetical protein